MENFAQALEVLEQALTWKRNSLAAYILSAQPYVAPGEEALLAKVQQLADEDERLATEVARMIERLGEVPVAGTHEIVVGEYNYLGLGFLAGKLREQLERERQYYERMLREGQFPAGVGAMLGLLKHAAIDQLAVLKVEPEPAEEQESEASTTTETGDGE